MTQEISSLIATLVRAVNPQEFSGKRVLVTGGTQGIGEAIARRLARDGGIVTATARSSFASLPAGVDFIAADISTVEGANKVIQEVLARHGDLDILVNNVGGSSAPGGGALALSDQDWQETLDTNLLSAVRLDRGFLPSMLYQGSV